MNIHRDLGILFCPKNQTPLSFSLMGYKTDSIAAPPVESAIRLIRGQRVLMRENFKIPIWNLRDNVEFQILALLF